MRNRNPRRGDRWDDRDRPGDRYDRESGLSAEDGPYRSDEEYFGRREMYGQGMGSGDAPDRASSWRGSGSYGRDYDRENRDRYGRRGEYRERRDNRGVEGGHPDSWVGRSNFETGFAGWGSNRYDHGQYDPYWTSNEENDRDRDRDRQGGRGRRHWWDKAADEVASWFGDNEAERRRQTDYRREGNFRGRGPKGYTRSDERIKDDVNDRLTDDYALDASEIDVQVNNGEVTLSGTVDSRYEKRRAEDVAESVSGVKNVENRLRVSDYQRSDWNADTQGDYNAERTDPDYYNGQTDDRSRGVGGTT